MYQRVYYQQLRWDDAATRVVIKNEISNIFIFKNEKKNKKKVPTKFNRLKKCIRCVYFVTLTIASPGKKEKNTNSCCFIFIFFLKDKIKKIKFNNFLFLSFSL